MRYEFHQEALNEFEAAARYYSRRQPGLDLRFIAGVREAVDRILEEPARWRAFDDDVRRRFTTFFPTPFSIRSSAITSSLLPSRTVAGSQATGRTGVPDKRRCQLVGLARFT